MSHLCPARWEKNKWVAESVKIGSVFYCPKISKKYQKNIKKVLTMTFLCDIMVVQKQEKEVKMTPKEIAEKANVSEARVYQIAKQLGRLPTVEEIESRKGKRGRPKKYEWKEGGG